MSTAPNPQLAQPGLDLSSTPRVPLTRLAGVEFRKALDTVVGARNSREATRQICRPYEYQLIGAFTKRPN